MKLKGSLSIGRIRCSDREDYICIRITDERSGREFAEVEVGLAEFAQAVTGLGHMPCDLELRGLENVGKVRELKREILPSIGRTGSDVEDEVAARAAIAPYEVDGWRGDWRALLNRHNKTSEGLYWVAFTRFVDAEDAK